MNLHAAVAIEQQADTVHSPVIGTDSLDAEY